MIAMPCLAFNSSHGCAVCIPLEYYDWKAKYSKAKGYLRKLIGQ